MDFITKATKQRHMNGSLILKEAIKDPLFCEIIGTVRYTRPKTNKQESTVLLNTNKMMRKRKISL